MFSDKQREYIINNLRRPENDLKIAEIATIISENLDTLQREIVLDTAFIMNLGEMHPDIAFIYEDSRNFRDIIHEENESPEIQKSISNIRKKLNITEDLTGWDLNKLHGEYSVQMAKDIGINLTPEQEQIISGHSKGEYGSLLGQVLKIAEICRATEQPRKFDGKDVPPAQSWQEVENILGKTPGLSQNLISITKQSYGKYRFKELNKDSHDTNIEF